MDHILSIRNQRCPNLSCKSSVILHGQKRKRFKCRLCGVTWGALHESPLYGLRSSTEKIHEAIECMRRGMSIRNIAQSVGVSKNTVVRWKKRFKGYTGSYAWRAK